MIDVIQFGRAGTVRGHVPHVSDVTVLGVGSAVLLVSWIEVTSGGSSHPERCNRRIHGRENRACPGLIR